MTIATTTSSVAYTGNGTTTAFAVPFAFFAAGDLEVIERVVATGVETTKALTTDYTVSGGNGSTGTVNAFFAPASSVTWTIRRVTAAVQTLDLVSNNPFPSASLELALDRATVVSQELQRDLGRGVLVPKSESGVTLPSSTARAGLFLAFDALGTPIPAIGPTGTGIAVSSYGATLVNTADAAAARTVLNAVNKAGDTMTGRLNLGDAVQYIDIAAGNPLWAWDANDYILFNRTTNLLSIVIGAVSRASVSATGIITCAALAPSNPVTTRGNLGLPDPQQGGANILVNGGFDVWQSGTSIAIAASTTATASVYGPDQWCMETSANQACTISQQAGTGQARFRAQVQRNSGQTGTAVLRFQQPLELADCIRLRGQTVTVSGTIKGGATFAGTLRVKLLTGTGAESRRTNAGAFTGEATPMDTALVVTASDATFTATSTAIGAAITQAALVFEWTPSGTAGANDWFEVQDVALQFGAVATAFPRPDYGETLRRCQRFLSTFSAALATSGAIGSYTLYFNYPMPMRGTPTITGAVIADANVTAVSLTALDTQSMSFAGDFSAAGHARRTITASARL